MSEYNNSLRKPRQAPRKQDCSNEESKKHINTHREFSDDILNMLIFHKNFNGFSNSTKDQITEDQNEFEKRQQVVIPK